MLTFYLPQHLVEYIEEFGSRSISDHCLKEKSVQITNEYLIISERGQKALEVVEVLENN